MTGNNSAFTLLKIGNNYAIIFVIRVRLGFNILQKM